MSFVEEEEEEESGRRLLRILWRSLLLLVVLRDYVRMYLEIMVDGWRGLCVWDRVDGERNGVFLLLLLLLVCVYMCV